MKAKIKKDVRPYGGRTFDVVARGTYRGGREYVELDVTSPRTKFGLLGKTSSPRRYYLDEVELIDDQPKRFRTTDGYTLIWSPENSAWYTGPTWDDRDLVFYADAAGHPIEATGERLEGDYLA